MAKKSLFKQNDARIYFSLLSLSKKSGPSLIFSLARVEERMTFLQSLENTYDCHFLMAVKSFPAKPVIKLAAKYLSGFDISNESELKLISNYKFRKLISITGPSYMPENFLLNKNARARGKIIFNCDHIEQYRSLMKIQGQQKYVIRLNSDSFLCKKNILSRFGICADRLNLMSQMLKERQHNFLGFHFHSGWQNNQSSDYVCLAEAAVRLSKKIKRPIDLLNLGGGFGNFSEREITSMIKKVRRVIPKKTKLFFEAGRFLSQNAGFAIGHIQKTFEMSNQYYIVLDLSKDCHLQWSQPRVLSVNENLSLEKKMVSFCGPTCSEIDILGKLDCIDFENLSNDKKVIGLPIFFSNISSYSMARNHSFNGIQKARVHFIK